MTDNKPKNRFYWVEGVTRSEVEKSLADRQPSRLRQQGPRRALVQRKVNRGGAYCALCRRRI